jgi:uncharacterized protein YdhG (YjbR/CyaY superfamily)
MTTVDSYIAAQPPNVAHRLERLRATIHKAAPGATEDITCGMPVFRLGEGYIFYVGAWKKHLGIYPIHPQEPTLEAELAPLRAGKDTVRLRYDDPIPFDLIARLVKARVRYLRARSSG